MPSISKPQSIDPEDLDMRDHLVQMSSELIRLKAMISHHHAEVDRISDEFSVMIANLLGHPEKTSQSKRHSRHSKQSLSLEEISSLKNAFKPTRSRNPKVIRRKAA